MKEKKTKKAPYRILKIIWFLIGGLIALWTISWAIKIKSVDSLGVVIIAIFLAMGIYGLVIFVIITLLFLLIKWIIKKCKKKK